MEEAQWMRISKWTPAVEVSGSDLDDPYWWLPEAFFCFYERNEFQHVLPFIAVHVDDGYSEQPSLVREALISAGWLDYGVGRKAKDEWGKDYSVCYSHLWMKDRKDDGSLHFGDAREIWEDDDIPENTIKITTFAYPLEVITGSDTLREKIVQPLLAAISNETSPSEPKLA